MAEIREDLVHSIMDYFKYIGKVAAYGELEGFEPLEQARITQYFMDIIEEDKYSHPEDDNIGIGLKVDVPEEIRSSVLRLVTFYVLDKFVEYMVERIIDEVE